METGSRTVLPVARSEELIVEELPDEMLIYDLRTHRALCLNQTAALVWKHCDGKTSAGQLTRVLSEKIAGKIDPQVVWLALRQLERHDLLGTRVRFPPAAAEVTRRQMLSRLGVSAALTLPLILAISSPTRAQAASGGAAIGAACTSDSDCASGCCSANVCSDPAACGAGP